MLTTSLSLVSHCLHLLHFLVRGNPVINRSISTFRAIKLFKILNSLPNCMTVSPKVCVFFQTNSPTGVFVLFNFSSVLLNRLQILVWYIYIWISYSFRIYLVPKYSNSSLKMGALSRIKVIFLTTKNVNW